MAVIEGRTAPLLSYEYKILKRNGIVDTSIPEFDLNIHCKVRISEIYSKINQDDKKSMDVLEKAIEERITKEVSR